MTVSDGSTRTGVTNPNFWMESAIFRICLRLCVRGFLLCACRLVTGRMTILASEMDMKILQARAIFAARSG